jgi:hypothetical protein
LQSSVKLIPWGNVLLGQVVVIQVIREFYAVMQHGASLPCSQMATIESFLDVVQSGSHRKNLYVQDILKFYPTILALAYLAVVFTRDA